MGFGVLKNLFSSKRRMLRGEVPDVYTYDLPDKLRRQVVLIFNEILDGVGRDTDYRGPSNSDKLLDQAIKLLRKERGVFALYESKASLEDELFNYFLREKDPELAMDVIQVFLTLACKWPSGRAAVGEVNERFQLAAVGYQYVDGQIVRVDSEFIHAEAVKPTLFLLNDLRFTGAEDEFKAAHEHYRHGRHKEALVEALKSFESTMKTICDQKKWSYDPRAAANGLIKACYDNGLIADSMREQFACLRSLLEGGLPTIRNRNAGHGQGAIKVEVPAQLAAYGLHLTAANIVFLVRTFSSTSTS